jgi:ubiquinone/menaquinone biosynthesis C-methylase UbiE
LQHWDNYWQKTKTLNSFAESEQGLGYTGDIAQFWQHIFTKLAPNASILDLATGNGGLAVLALQANDNFVISASDKANIAPLQLFTEQDASYKYLQKIQFFGNMPSEALTFADAEFDMVISQFGLEYAEPVSTLQQLHRILKPAGKLVALVHHSESFISSDCWIGIAVLQVFTDENGLLLKIKQFATFCEPLQKLPALTIAQQQLLKQQSDHLLASFKASQQVLSAEQREWFNDIAKNIVPLLGDWRSLTVLAVNKLMENLHYFSQRLADQLTATWSIEKIKTIQQLAEQQGFSVSVSTLDTKEGKLCWIVQITKD